MVEIKEEQIKKNIFDSITSIMEEVPAIGKDKLNKQQGFKFRGIDDVMNTLQPLLSKHKVFIVPEILEQIREERTTQKGGNLIYSICKIKYKFYAEDGSYIEAITIGEGMDSGDKATNKAMAIAMKYALFQVFCIPTEEMKDPDGETPEESKPKGKTNSKTDNLDSKVTDREATAIYAIMTRKGVDVVPNLKKNYNITNTKDLTRRQYISILNAMNKLPDKKTNNNTETQTSEVTDNGQK